MFTKCVDINRRNDNIYVYTECEQKGKLMKTAKEIGEILTKLRGDRTQSQVAKDLGISESAISMYERGERVPRDEIKVQLSKYYKKPIEKIFF